MNGKESTSNSRFIKYVYIATILYIFVLFLVAIGFVRIDATQFILSLETYQYPGSLIGIASRVGNQYPYPNGATTCVLLLQITSPLILLVGVILAKDLFKKSILTSATKRTRTKNILSLFFSLLMSFAMLFSFIFLIGKDSPLCFHCESGSAVFMLTVNFLIILLSGILLSTTFYLYQFLIKNKGI